MREIRDLPLDDNICECPPAVAHHETLRARRATFPWLSVSMSVKDNVANLDTLLELSQQDLQHAWNSVPSSLLNIRRPGARFKIKPEVAIEMIYNLASHPCFPEESAAS